MLENEKPVLFFKAFNFNAIISKVGRLASEDVYLVLYFERSVCVLVLNVALCLLMTNVF